MVDLEKVRTWRLKMREVIGLKDGQPITDEMLSAALGILMETWSLRIWCSSEKHVPDKDVLDLCQRISGEIQSLMQEQAKRYLPHSKTMTMFRRPS